MVAEIPQVDNGISCSSTATPDPLRRCSEAGRKLSGWVLANLVNLANLRGKWCLVQERTLVFPTTYPCWCSHPCRYSPAADGFGGSRQGEVCVQVRRGKQTYRRG